VIAHDLALALKRYEQLYDALKPKLSLWQLIVMQAMSGNKNSREDQLAEKTGLNPAIVSNVLHTLRKKKYVVNVSGGRPKKVAYTEAGMYAVAEGLKLLIRADEEFFRGSHKCAGVLTDALQEVTT